MDFEGAAQRLAQDQKKIRGRHPVVVSEKAKRQAELQRKQREKLQAERERKRLHEEFQKQYVQSCERALHVRKLGGSQSEHLLLQPTSIHGTGDKISLPPSVLETLTADMGDSLESPWTFRIGILNPDYQFPASSLIQIMKLPNNFNDDIDEDDGMIDSEDEGEGDDKLPYLEELAHKYIAYTHCTVVEFTQDEGNVGIPLHIASSLLDSKNRLPVFVERTIPVTRTVDPAKSSEKSQTSVKSSNNAMDEDATTATPGHIAYGAFDIPAVSLEISLVNLPKGVGCTLVPTKEAVQRGFYALKDVKLVLEQSLIRTRATLSKGDVVSTWHRGVQYDLDVTKVVPSMFQAVTCINTDIEVEIGETEANGESPSPKNDESSSMASLGHTLGTGRNLGSKPSIAPKSVIDPAPSTNAQTAASTVLLPEPPIDQTENTIYVQIQYRGGNGKRRFDVTKATIRDLMQYTASLLSSQDISSFRLVTRFPRRVFTADSAESTLIHSGIQSGKELFLVEMI